MNKKILFPLTILGLMLLFANNTFAQLDSLYTQQWNRDPINDLNVTTSAQRQIITAEQIRVSGYTQLSQVLQLIDGWTINYTVSDNFSPQLQSNGTGSYNQQNWVLMLNGQRVEMNRDGALNVNDLAILVYDIERIEVVNSNGMYLGEYTQYGLINIITKKQNVNGLNANAYVGASVNEEESTTNLNTNIYTADVGAISLGYTRNKFHINSAIAYQNTSRYNPYFGPTTYVNSRVEMQYIGNKISHQIQTQSIIPYPDSRYRLFSYLGQWNINEHNQIRFSNSSNLDIQLYSKAFQFKNTLQHRYLKRHSNGNFIWQNGLGYDRVYRWFSNSSVYNVGILKPYSSINVPVNPRINLFADAQVAFAHDKVAPKISVGMYKRVSLISNYSFVLAYTETLLEETFLTSVNQDINALHGAPYYYNPKLATADFYYNLNFGNSVKFSFNSGLKNAYDVPDYRYYLAPTGPLSTIDYRVEDYVKRATYQLNWINRFNFHYDIVKNLVFDINYMNTRIVNTWDENLRNIPKHKFTFVLQYDLPKRFTLWSRNYIQSKTQWFNAPGYYNMYNGTELYYTQPAQFGWEIGLSKKLFKKYLHLNITARNLFAKGVNYNPDQLNYSGRLFVSIIFNINGIGGGKAPKP